MHSIQLPISKSIANRCMVLAALRNQDVDFLPEENSLPNDVLVMKQLLFANNSKEYDVQDAGTVYRFILAYLCLKPGTHLLYGTATLNTRPIHPLVDSLQSLGAEITYVGPPNQAPLKIMGKNLHTDTLTVDASRSSQFVSALMLIAPFIPNGLRIEVQNPASLPYINITKKCMEYYGLKVEYENNKIEIPQHTLGNSLAMQTITIEKDWSSAAFWYALCATTGYAFFLPKLSLISIQGDKICADLFKKLGVQSHETESGIEIKWDAKYADEIEFNLADCPDIAPVLIVSCAVNNSEVKFFGLETLKHKESDRTLALQTELKKLYINFMPQENYWILQKHSNEFKSNNSKVLLDTYNDHRLAMAFSCFRFHAPWIEILNPSCAKKSYPMFWEEFNTVYPLLNKE